jgi:hypothetical protein
VIKKWRVETDIRLVRDTEEDNIEGYAHRNAENLATICVSAFCNSLVPKKLEVLSIASKLWPRSFGPYRNLDFKGAELIA